MKILNLYSGIGGNRKLWGDNHEITAVEYDPKIAEIYKDFFPKDNVVIGDAHDFLIKNFEDYDFIWSSPPCQSRSKMMKATRHKKKKYPDLSVEQEVIFLKHFFKGGWVVENVKSYFEDLIPGKDLGRHRYWSNFDIGNYIEKTPENFINLCNVSGKKKLMDWLDMHFEKNVYYNGNHCPAQVLRNCVHPKEGLAILNAYIRQQPVLF